MNKLTKLFTSWASPDIQKVAEKQLDKNIKVVESLRDYDQGKKDISTVNLQNRLPNIRVASQR